MGDIVFPGGLRPDGLPAALSAPGRLAAVRATGLLDTGPEGPFDDLARLAAAVTGCRRAFITLVDERRSFWKSCIGVAGAADVASRQGPVRESFCYFLVGLGGAPFVIEDAAADPRTSSHPSVRPMKIGAWAGYPLLTPAGQVLGSMCVIDENPHPWQPEELGALAAMARAVSNEISMRTSLATAQAALAVAEAALAASTALARSLQDSLLPPVLRPVPGLQAAASYLPAAGGTVTGDFYDLFHARGPWWCTVMGDVCGKGTEAAKVTALARYTLRAEATQHLSPAAVLTQLNRALLDQRAEEGLLTAAYATFRTTPGGLAGRLCTAGHPPALIRRADGRVREAGRPGSLLGFLPDVSLADARFRLSAGDVLLLYTDGATDARPRRAPGGPSVLFGQDALSPALAGCAGLDAAGVITRLGEVLARHCGGWASDDTALLALRVPPAGEST
jgi:serine phosphatase RsbU (regulator of sigma subunit)